MSDIVKRLLNDAESHYEVARSADMRPEDTLNWEHGQNCQDAADTITRLTSEVERLTVEVEAAKKFGNGFYGEKVTEGVREVYRGFARATLSGDKQ
jgi:hypothetical protein